MTELRLATRSSRLALTQSRWVADRLAAVHEGLKVSLVEVTTSGDIDRSSPVAALTEMGAFVRSVQTAVLEGRADAAVHSCKDLPVLGPEQLTAIYPEREHPWDVLCGSTLEALRDGARVGTGSPRRAAQLRRLRPDLEIAEIRGNVETRLAAVKSGTVDAVVLAEAGLRRLGLTEAIDHVFDIKEMVPAPAQASLAIEAVAGSTAAELVSALDHAPTRVCVEAERSLLAITGAGCRSALGALAQVELSTMGMYGFVEDEDGARSAWASAPEPGAVAEALRIALALGLGA
ncbi:MAG: hydroxymethylbilane synthase [Acidimicrobiia bacterium]